MATVPPTDPKKPTPPGTPAGGGKPAGPKPAAKPPAPKHAPPKNKFAHVDANTKRLGVKLVDLGFLDDLQVEDMYEEMRTSELGLGQIAVARSLINDDQLLQATAEVHGMKVANLEDVKPAPDALKVVPKNMAELYKMVPIAYDGGTLTVAVSDPNNMQAGRIDLDLGRRIQSIQRAGREGALDQEASILTGGRRTGSRHRVDQTPGIQVNRHLGDAVHRQRIELGGLANRRLVGPFVDAEGLGLVGVGKGLYPAHADSGVVGIHLLFGGLIQALQRTLREGPLDEVAVGDLTRQRRAAGRSDLVSRIRLHQEKQRHHRDERFHGRLQIG